MKTERNTLSLTRINRLRTQGYSCESDLKLSNMAFGIRFAYRLCVSILIIAIVTKSILLFSIMLGIAFLGVVLPNHPFDYIYNIVLSSRMKKPKLPKRSRQLKFACIIATSWLAYTIYMMSTGYTTTGLILAGILAGIAIFPSTTDICIPSLIYNILFQKKEK